MPRSLERGLSSILDGPISVEKRLAKLQKPRKTDQEAEGSGTDIAAGGSFPIVGIGMSAGGLEVASTFLRAMPANSGMAFVIIQHLDPTRESLLADLLQRETTMPLVQVEEGMRVEANHVYIIVPAKTLLIEDGILRLIEPEEKRGLRHPIDKFFTSLAQDQKEKAIAIVLTGAGSNGTAGLMDIKQAGGLCIAQEPKTAKFDSMPRHAIASDVVDYVLAPEDMPKALLAYAQHSYIHDNVPEVIATSSATGIDDVLTLLHTSGIHDFRQYKRATLSRRIHRRMGLAHIEQLSEYIALLKSDPEELPALGKDLMINVTAFFRDPDAWSALEREVIAPMIDKAAPEQSIRAWVPACSTGEEAYSIAMLLIEHSEASGKALNIKIFATDAADHHLGSARKATFPGSMVESLSPERLARFFDKIDDSYYRVKAHVREVVLFAPQDLLHDPPYSRMDLVSCRNLLIYLQPPAQDKVLSLAHFALREGGYLFLGNAETIGARGHLFADVSKRWRIYRRIGTARSPAISFADWPTRDDNAPRANGRAKLSDIAIKTLADRFAPASVLIDRSYRVLHFHGVTDDYLAQPAGSPTMDLLALARDGLRLTIRSAVQKAIEDKQPVTVRATIKLAGGPRTVLVTASTVRQDGDENGMILVNFEQDQEQGAAARPEQNAVLTTDEVLRGDIEEELRSAREEMRRTVEQHETTNEELTAANEEVTSVNEELQATNEELEASKEELQALNEELSTINAQLDRKIIELGDVSDDLKNLLMGNDIATIFLDTNMRIKWFTPAIQTVFSLIEKDIGRPIASFAQKFKGGDLIEKAQAAVAHLTTSEADVASNNDRCYRMRVLPYRTHDNRIAGAVATFVDITDLKSIQTKTLAAKEFSAAIVETVRDPLLVLGGNLHVQTANAAFYKMFSIDDADTIGALIYELGNGMWDNPELRLLLEEMLPQHEQIDDFELEISSPHADVRNLLINARRITDDAGEDNKEGLILLSIDDITERKALERHQEMMVGELSHRVKNTLAVVQSIASQTRRHSTSLAQFGEAFGGRIQALANANDLVIDGNWKGVQLREILERALRPFAESGQFVIADGPAIDIRPQAALTLAMIVHELATNASKYGALSVRAGAVSIQWRIEPGDHAQRLRLDWYEAGGPEVAPPKRQGQGIRFIERSMAYDLKGEAILNFATDGLQATLGFPLTEAIAPKIENTNVNGRRP